MMNSRETVHASRLPLRSEQKHFALPRPSTPLGELEQRMVTVKCACGCKREFRVLDGKKKVHWSRSHVRGWGNRPEVRAQWGNQGGL